MKRAQLTAARTATRLAVALLAVGSLLAGLVAAPSPAAAADVPAVRTGASGEAVRTIQYLLRHHGADIVVDGDFGDQTDQRVREFQGANGLDPDGVVGPLTWPKLFVTVRRNDQGDAVRAAQSQLAARGIAIAVDGDFGEQTDEKVRAFQQANGLATDGVVGPLTWAALVDQGPSPGLVPAGLYTLRNGATVTVLDSSADRKVSLQAPDGGPSQNWMVEDGPDGHVFLRSLGTDLYLESDPQEGIWDVHTQTKNGGESQQWKPETGTDGRFMLRNRATGRMLARPQAFSPQNPNGVHTASLAAGAQGVPSLQWRLTPAQP